MPEQGFTCVLVDDNGPVLEALATLLRQEGIEIVGTAKSGAEALQLLEQFQPAAVVVDLRLPDINGIEVARRAAELPRLRPAVIIYTSFAERSLVTKALTVGARAVVLKDAPPANLLEAISVVASGGVYIDSRLRTGPRRTR
jgi:DNA-binding NarL/FixJ family response regulator